MAPILPHMELKPTHAFLTLQDENMNLEVQSAEVFPRTLSEIAH